LFIRHEKIEQLEKLKALVLYTRQNVSNTPQYMHSSYSSLLKGSKKLNISEKIFRGETFTLFLDSIADEKLPKSIASGHFLKGELVLYKDSKISKIVNNFCLIKVKCINAYFKFQRILMRFCII